jgi:hypothetical protein
MRFTNFVLVLAVGVGTAPIVMAGCGGGDETTTSTTTTTTSSSSGGNLLPCDPKAPECREVASSCIALADNSAATTFGLRMGQLTVTKPDVLSKGVVANIVANGVTMNLDQCNLAGGGTFSWLAQFNTTTGKLLTGGGKPAADPIAGYCFVDEMVNGFPIAPVEVDSALMDRKFSAKVGDITVPIYLDAMASGVVLLPLKQGVLSGELSADNNCVGKYNADTLDPGNNCLAEPPDKLAFTNGGTLEGYITLEAADAVIVDSLSQSLCVLLSGDAAMYGDGGSPAKCKRDAMMKIVYPGDWCDATNAAADMMCADSAKLGAEFAASAVKINGTCM